METHAILRWLFLLVVVVIVYDKSSKSIDEQVELLLQTGMGGDAESIARRLTVVNYYRLSGYWYPFAGIVWRSLHRTVAGQNASHHSLKIRVVYHCAPWVCQMIGRGIDYGPLDRDPPQVSRGAAASLGKVPLQVSLAQRVPRFASPAA